MTSAPAPEPRPDQVRWDLRRPARVIRWSGLVTLVTLFASSLLLGTGFAPILPGTFGQPSRLNAAGPLLFMVSLLSAIVYLTARTGPAAPATTKTSGALEVTESEIVLTGKKVNTGAMVLAAKSEARIALSDVEAGWEDAAGRAVLRLRGGRELTVDAGGPEGTAAVLRAAGVEQRVARLPIRSALGNSIPGRVAGAVALFVTVMVALAEVTHLGAAAMGAWRGLTDGASVGHAALACLPPVLVLLGLLRVFAPRTAVIGKDGVAIEGMLTRRFLPFTEITGVARRDWGVILTRARGVFKHVHLRHAPGGEGLSPRISAAMSAHHEHTSGMRLERLDRRGRTITDWLSDLKGMTDRAAPGYRARPVLPEQLAEVVEDAAAPRERRLAAAISAGASGDEAARTRIRIAAQALADDELRAALEQAAEGEITEEALTRAARSD